ncbi:MAG: hypothetical protein DME26_09795 [Verrucomicrobia bacterium]|nr:MAG: hypothetical protein DME26_09795 [Verrucomicrobiota bacterium]
MTRNADRLNLEKKRGISSAASNSFWRISVLGEECSQSKEEKAGLMGGNFESGWPRFLGNSFRSIP